MLQQQKKISVGKYSICTYHTRCIYRADNKRSLRQILENRILVVRVPANMTHLFQPLNLTVNESANDFIKNITK